MRRPSVTLALVLLLAAAPAVAAPEGELTWAVHISLAPTWFDPAETPSVITPFMMLYALHDALVKPMPGHPLAPSLAESWSLSKDGLAYEFVLRKGVKFHNGDPVGAEDVKFSLERYKRKTPSVKRLILRSVPDDTTRLAMLKRGEADIAYSLRGPLGEEVRRTPGLTLKAAIPTFTEWLVFVEQWDPKSPWADRRV